MTSGFLKMVGKTVLMLGLLATVGCAQQAATSQPSPTAAKAVGTAPPAAAVTAKPAVTVASPTPVPAAKAAKEKLVYMPAGEIATLDGIVLVSETGRDWLQQMYEPLVGRDPRTMEPKAALATKWEQVAPTRWRFELRKGVKFHNGNSLTARDVVDTVNYAVEMKSQVLDSVAIKSAQAIDDYTVELTLNSYDPRFLEAQLWFNIYPSYLVRDNKNLLATTAIGTGPYKMANWTKGTKFTMEAYKDYWGPQPPFRTVEFIPRQESVVRTAALQSGEADIIAEVPSELVAKVPRSVSSPALEPWTIRFDLDVKKEVGPPGPTADKRVRLAIAEAIDREALAKEVLGGLARPLDGQMVLPGMHGYNPDVRAYPFKPDEAKQLIKDAGAVGKTVVIVGPAGRFTKGREMYEAVAGMVQQTGLKVDLRIVELSEWVPYALSQSKGRKLADLSVYGAGLEYLGAEVAFKKYLASDGSLSMVRDKTLDGMIKQALDDTTPTTREQKDKAVIAYARDSVTHVWVAMPMSTWGLAPSVDWQPGMDGRFYVNEVKAKN